MQIIKIQTILKAFCTYHPHLWPSHNAVFIFSLLRMYLVSLIDTQYNSTFSLKQIHDTNVLLIRCVFQLEMDKTFF